MNIAKAIGIGALIALAVCLAIGAASHFQTMGV